MRCVPFAATGGRIVFDPERAFSPTAYPSGGGGATCGGAFRASRRSARRCSTRGDRAAVIYTLAETAKLNGLDPESYIAAVLDRLARGHPINRLAELLPWNIQPKPNVTGLAQKGDQPLALGIMRRGGQWRGPTTRRSGAGPPGAPAAPPGPPEKPSGQVPRRARGRQTPPAHVRGKCTGLTHNLDAVAGRSPCDFAPKCGPLAGFRTPRANWRGKSRLMRTAAYDDRPAAPPARAAAPAAAAAVGPDYSVEPTGDPYVDALIAGVRWTHPVSYSFPDEPSDYEPDVFQAHDYPGFGAISFAQAQVARIVLEGSTPLAGGPGGILGVEQFTLLDLSDAGTTGGGDIRLAQSDHPATAYAFYPPGPEGQQYWGGDIWFGTSYDYGNAVMGTYAYHTLMHELGHALGLSHGHDGGGISGAPVRADRDSMEFTVMTYRAYVGGPTSGYANEYAGFAQSWMMLDIAALQAIYGADYRHNAGNTVYRWNPTTGETFIDGVGRGAPADNRIFLTLWDGGGTDT